MNIVHICYISADIFKDIEYTDFNNLTEQLINMINCIKYDIQVELLFNNNVLCTFKNINISILSTIKNNDSMNNSPEGTPID